MTDPTRDYDHLAERPELEDPPVLQPEDRLALRVGKSHVQSHHAWTPDQHLVAGLSKPFDDQELRFCRFLPEFP